MFPFSLVCIYADKTWLNYVVDFSADWAERDPVQNYLIKTIYRVWKVLFYRKG